MSAQSIILYGRTAESLKEALDSINASFSSYFNGEAKIIPDHLGDCKFSAELPLKSDMQKVALGVSSQLHGKLKKEGFQVQSLTDIDNNKRFTL